jgi:Methyl-accepting chemotaxis protein (MCP) signalling domain
MNAINAASRKIADIIGVIDEIAFQTNLLALNAAVEQPVLVSKGVGLRRSQARCGISHNAAPRQPKRSRS